MANKFHNFLQRKYDYAKIEKMLLDTEEKTCAMSTYQKSEHLKETVHHLRERMQEAIQELRDYSFNEEETMKIKEAAKLLRETAENLIAALDKNFRGISRELFKDDIEETVGYYMDIVEKESGRKLFTDKERSLLKEYAWLSINPETMQFDTKEGEILMDWIKKTAEEGYGIKNGYPEARTELMAAVNKKGKKGQHVRG